MNSIRGRILLAFLALSLLVTPFVIFSYSSYKKVNRAKYFKEQVVFFNINRLKAASAFSNVLDTDTKIDSFYLSGTTKNLKRYKNYVRVADDALREVKSSEFSQDTIVGGRLDAIQKNIAALQSIIDTVLALQVKRGFKDFGLEGNMRKHIHSLENVDGITLAENLMLRRHEKDFFLRDDPIYTQLLNRKSDSIIQRMSANTEKNQKSIDVLKNYQESFNAIVSLEREIGNENRGYVREIYVLNQRLDHGINQLYQIVDTNLQLLTNSIRSYIVLFFVITVVFAILFSIFFSGHIAIPLQRLVTDMDYITEKNFEGGLMVQPGINVSEINRLTSTYNSLIAKIRHQIVDLNENNKALNGLNVKLKESEEELKEASRVKDKFFSIISHDLRGHTGNVLSLAKILDEESTLSEKEKTVFTKYLVDSSQNLQLLLDNLLNWAKTQMNDHDMSKKAFHVSKLIEGNMTLFKDNAQRKGIVMEFEQSKVSKAFADKDMMDFVIRNLLSNALKFTTKGDTVTFRISEKDNFIVISISDTGVGMTKKQMDTLMNANTEGYTTKGTQNEIGTGLGFSICKDFVERNGGKINISSERGTGSVFSFTVPTSLTRESILS
ncbi:HAMP domain-containing histidine kinase [Muricauda sp. SCSIO 64092]|uniref:sensor histidine kinase n=1 Tax=Allomuricauda sp. SCSIO 64092 TaxID=2908842 RepID=UPI001FF48E21|nr:HAMP domain-containing sensor histidine kinase [Muricauda sp. SCSIO 64092]UOY06720.1 HAMP domain-containing histidine kinase [Muricauda sp. SCSIO 64092]